MLTDPEKTDVRRFCGYPAYGAGVDGFDGWRFYQVYGLLEYRMTNLSCEEESVVRRYLAQLRGIELAVPSVGGQSGYGPGSSLDAQSQ